MLSYRSALKRLLSLADFEHARNLPAGVRKPDLIRMEELMRRMGYPNKSIPTVHIAGTKGKGSVASMISSVLTAGGSHVGLFTSPHLHRFTERIRIDGKEISQDLFADQLEKIWPHVESMGHEGERGKPSLFEVLNGMAFQVFNEKKLDFQVLEVGLGGRLDSTNVAYAEVAVITSLSLDHTEILGADIESIAREKAGIIKKGSRVVLSPQPPEVEDLIKKICETHDAPLWSLREDVNWTIESHGLSGQMVTVNTPTRRHRLWVPLVGAHQAENAAAAVSAIDLLGDVVTLEGVKKGFQTVEWPARFQIVSESPLVIVDGAHNPLAALRLAETFSEVLGSRKAFLVFGCSADKDVSGILRELEPVTKSAILCQSRHPKGMALSELGTLASLWGMEYQTSRSVANAMELMTSQMDTDDILLVTGSLFVAAESLEWWFGIEPELYSGLS